MKAIISSILAIFLIAFAIGIFSQPSEGSPQGGVCVTFHATANVNGKYCGPTSGTFTVGSNGTVQICGLTTGSYTFCTDNYELGYVTIVNDQLYNVYVTAEGICPCP